MLYFEDTPINLVADEVLSPSPLEGAHCAFVSAQHVSPHQRYPAALNTIDVGFEFYQDEARLRFQNT